MPIHAHNNIILYRIPDSKILHLDKSRLLILLVELQEGHLHKYLHSPHCIFHKVCKIHLLLWMQTGVRAVVFIY